MFEKEIAEVLYLLKNHNVTLQKGMSESEIKAAEQIYHILFPADVRELFMTAFPISHPFYNWTDFSIKIRHIFSKL